MAYVVMENIAVTQGRQRGEHDVHPGMLNTYPRSST
jgi:hypothetical protein